MSDPSQSPQEARAALDEAVSRGATVRRTDRQLQRIVMAIAACYLAAGVIVSLSPDRQSPLIWPAIMILVVGFCVGIILFGLRLRALSRHGQLWYIWGVFAFNVWMGLVVGVSIGTRWWASTQPSYHFAVTIAIGVVPLVVLAWLLGRRS